VDIFLPWAVIARNGPLYMVWYVVWGAKGFGHEVEVRSNILKKSLLAERFVRAN
jgi:hypothetical protein